MGLEELKKRADLRAEQMSEQRDAEKRLKDTITKAVGQKVGCITNDFKQYFLTEGFNVNNQNMGFADADKMRLVALYKDIMVTLREVSRSYSPDADAQCTFALSIEIDKKNRAYDIMIRKKEDVPLQGADSLVISIRKIGTSKDTYIQITDFKQTLDELMDEGL